MSSGAPRQYVRRNIGSLTDGSRAKAYRDAVPEYAERNRKWNRVRHRALERLKNTYPTEYRRIFEDEWAKDVPAHDAPLPRREG